MSAAFESAPSFSNSGNCFGSRKAAASVADKMGDATALQVAAEIERASLASSEANAWLTDLAVVVSKGHNVIETLAEKGAFVIFQASGGTPKEPPAEVVASLLMNGPF